MNGPLLSCRGLTVRFGGLTALDGIDLDVRSGEILGLLGPNGSGKTTFFNALTGIYAPAAGRVELGGTDLTGRPAAAIYRAGITRTFQRSRLCLPLTVLDNIMIGNHRRLDHGVWFNLLSRRRLAAQVEAGRSEAGALASTFNPALGTRLDEAAGALTMIDRRRVEICRALISRPRLLLLDEPSAGMTHEETRALMDDILLVRGRMPGLTVVIIEHEMNVIERITDRCVVLNYGRKLCEGRYREIAANAEVQEAYLGQVS